MAKKLTLPTPESLLSEEEIYTLDDAKEALMIVRSCGSVQTLVKAIAAAIARTRTEYDTASERDKEQAWRYRQLSK